MSLKVTIMIPSGILWTATVEELILPSTTGLIGILKDHATMLTALDVGVVRLKTAGKLISFVVIEGVAEVFKNHIISVSNNVEEGASINLSEAQTEVAKGIKMVENAVTIKDKIDTTLALRIARARLQAVI